MLVCPRVFTSPVCIDADAILHKSSDGREPAVTRLSGELLALLAKVSMQSQDVGAEGRGSGVLQLQP